MCVRETEIVLGVGVSCAMCCRCSVCGCLVCYVL